MAKEQTLQKAAARSVGSIHRRRYFGTKKKDGKVTLVGFGTFSKAPAKAAKAATPDGEKITSKPQPSPSSKPVKTQRSAVIYLGGFLIC
jgi:DNA-binding protein HU-beta